MNPFTAFGWFLINTVCVIGAIVLSPAFFLYGFTHEMIARPKMRRKFFTQLYL